MRFHFRSGTLKSRVTALLILLVFLAAGLVALASLAIAERKMRVVVGDQEQALLTSVAAYIDKDLEAKRLLLSSLAEALDEDTLHDPRRLQSLLERRTTLRAMFFNVVAFDPSGKLIASLADPRTIGTINVAERDYFRASIAAHQGLLSAPFKSRISGKPTVLVTEPVYDQAGNFVFLLAGAIDLQQPSFLSQINALKPGTTGYLFIVTTDGLIVQHPESGRLLGNVRDHGAASPSMLDALRGVDGWAIGASRTGAPALLSYKRLRTADWIVGSVYPLGEAFAPLIDMRFNSLVASAGVAAVAGLIGWLTVLRLLRPFGALRQHVARLSGGGSDISVFNVGRQDEFGDLSRAFYGLSQQRARAEAALEAQARTDPLTGLHNRRMFEETFDAAIARARRTRTALALAYLDIDHFKRINDTLGHGVGDRVLIEFARRLNQAVRATDTVARLAGDEFVVIFENLADPALPQAMGQKILAAMQGDFAVGDQFVSVSCSVGIATGSAQNATMEQFLGSADAALYAAKDAGRGRVSLRAVAPA
ncbi:sensor domain-containing diguanylate cyclase [Massilia sp. S19_KUP03_FR1]|uniref:sensor domain-containing diguanylate cyclase n=1 Tax=Massilia sp. S19_KUP03_FR1 TaxID=3025503 RepID=UPI002FCD1D81